MSTAPTPMLIMRIVADHYGVTTDALTERGRTAPITHEQIAANLGLIEAHIDKHPDIAKRMCATLREWVEREPSPTDRKDP